MRVVIAGASGFLGTHLTEHLRSHGHEVTTLVRRDPTSSHESRWDPSRGEVDAAVVTRADAVVNLAGASIAGNPHSGRWAEEVLESRISTTGLLARTVAAAERPPALLAGNGIAWYGDHGDALVTEDADSRGDAFLTRVTREWSAAADPARDAGARVCVLRTAPVMDRTSPPLRQLRLLFKAGLGARLGSGEQYFPMISLRDWIGSVAYLLESRDVSGAFNLCCPTTPTNAEFTRELARAVRRPAFLAAPAAILKVAAGDLSSELLASVNARPAALERAGYDFEDEDVREVLAAALS
ncbi:TIGR01777 family oxidoreductase [Nocardioides okcheonensis]|uniref:TIGR01777 family oxidoreductase n=1 Tax=Nocardioides okcheonensis TaxID=2894081 RepID=UPI001E4862DA|nr:TIGR01777 family oxidoreductase [Nocardioides okcheonensis]UFN44739.1 TIGR01777 family oxidoreductase [Nocardioides okcheonensis]